MSFLTRLLAATGALILASGVSATSTGARNDGRRPLRLTEQTDLLGTAVPPGSYDLRWTREKGSETVKLEVTRGHRVLASGTGVWDSSDRPYPHEALVFRSAGGASELSEIRFRNSAELIRVQAGHEAGAAGAPSGSR